MAKSFDAELAALDALRTADAVASEAPLRKALVHRNNFIVAKAARLVADHDHRGLTAELATAFTRFLVDGAKSDPQCWAKNALIKTLNAFEYQEAELFLAGLECIQLEPVWGGSEDSAGTLRGQCAFGLVQCHSLSNIQVLTYLAPLFADKQLSVRINAARAVEQVGTETALLMLRLRAEMGSDAPELLGACYSGVLHLEGPSAIPWAVRFLRADDPDDTSAEAAFAIADTRSEAGFEALLRAWKQTRDQAFRETLLAAMALTRQAAAIDFLLGEAAEGSGAARKALEDSTPSQETLDRLNSL